MSIKQTRWLSEGFPLLLAALAVVIYMRSDIILLGKLSGYGAAGIYSAASQISEAWALLPLAFTPALFPMPRPLAQARRRLLSPPSRKTFPRHDRRRCLYLVRPDHYRAGSDSLLFGPSYAASVTVLRILAWAPPFVFIGIMQTGYDITEGLTWVATLRTAIGALINISLNLLLIPRYGPSGAAIATLISVACAGFVSRISRSRGRDWFSVCNFGRY